jgi:hypothetical protein
LGSGDRFLKTRSGDITTIPQSFGVSLEKFVKLAGAYGLRSVSAGEHDFYKLSEEVSDMVRTGSNGAEKKSEATTGSPKNVVVASSYDKCPQCGAPLTHQEGCTKCSSCTYSKC